MSTNGAPCVTTFGKTFLLGKTIGSGTHGRVVLASHSRTFYAVKFFDALKNAIMLESFQEEVRLQRKAAHTNVIHIFSSGCSKPAEIFFFVMEIADYVLKNVILGRTFDFPEAEVKGYMLQLFTGLAHCHTKGVAHLDLSPANILITNCGVLKIADFGFARDESMLGKCKDRAVTLWYRPPELLLHDIGHQQREVSFGYFNDIWSAGCIFAELSLRRAPFIGYVEEEMLSTIYRYCELPETPTLKELGWNDPFCEKLMENHSPTSRLKILEALHFLPSAKELLSTLLKIDYRERPTSSAVLQSPWFARDCSPSAFKPNDIALALRQLHHSPITEFKRQIRLAQASAFSHIAAPKFSNQGIGPPTKRSKIAERVLA